MAIFDGEKMFNTPKPVSLIERILSVTTDKEAWVLDFLLVPEPLPTPSPNSTPKMAATAGSS